MGDDFAFKAADHSFIYLDKFMKILEKHYESLYGQSVKIHYSTVNEYFDDLKEYNDGNIKFPEYSGDFLPYVQLESDTYDHWVGYYSSTPVLKNMIRDLFQQFRGLKVLQALIIKFVHNNSREGKHLEKYDSKIEEISQEASIMMHHDAITSTSPQRTLFDYMGRIKRAIEKINNISIVYLDEIFLTSDRSKTSIGVINPLPYTRTEFINITVPFPYIKLPSHRAQISIDHLSTYNRASLSPDTFPTSYILTIEASLLPLSFSTITYAALEQ
jgi:hypothetical protein